MTGLLSTVFCFCSLNVLSLPSTSWGHSLLDIIAQRVWFYVIDKGISETNWRKRNMACLQKSWCLFFPSFVHYLVGSIQNLMLTAWRIKITSFVVLPHTAPMYCDFSWKDPFLERMQGTPRPMSNNCLARRCLCQIITLEFFFGSLTNCFLYNLYVLFCDMLKPCLIKNPQRIYVQVLGNSFYFLYNDSQLKRTKLGRGSIYYCLTKI